MKKIYAILILLALSATTTLHAQKGKNKGGGNNEKVNVKVKTNDSQIKVKTNSKNGQVKIDVKNKGGKDNSDGSPKFKNGHDNGNHNGHYKNKAVWFFGPGDVYQVRGKNKRERIVIYNQVCIRLTTNIGSLFGLLGNVRIKLDAKKATLKPAKYNRIKMDLDLLDNDLKLLEIKKNKIKLRLGKLKG